MWQDLRHSDDEETSCSWGSSQGEAVAVWVGRMWEELLLQGSHGETQDGPLRGTSLLLPSVSQAVQGEWEVRQTVLT